MRFWLDTLEVLFSSPWTHRSLIMQMVRREVIGRYRGSLMGLLWSFINPVLMLAVYTFVFSEVFKAKWGEGTSDSKIDFALILFAGMIVYGIFAESVNRAPGLIVGNANFVKKVVFPLDVLPWVAMGATLFHAAVSVGVWATLFVIVKGYLPWTFVLLPLMVLPLVLLTLGCSWFLASTAVYLRDVSQTTGIITTILLFLSPIFYPIAALPERYRGLLELNPLTFPIEQVREIMMWGRMPALGGFLGYTFASLAVALFGLAWFQKTRAGFADVL